MQGYSSAEHGVGHVLPRAGGSILVEDGGTLVVRACDIIGNGLGADGYGAAYMGGGVQLAGHGTQGDFYNCTFTNWVATYAAAFYSTGGHPDSPLVSRFFGCSFVRNRPLVSGSLTIGWEDVDAAFYDCLFEDNINHALMIWESAPTDHPKVVVERCVRAF